MGVDYAKVMFGENAHHVPAFLYVQAAGDGSVSFVGGSKLPAGCVHPLHYGSERTHQLIIGEIVVRPHQVIASDAGRGDGIGSLLLGHRLDEFIERGEYLIGGAA